MELRQLKYVITIAQCKTMLKAAEQLYISQSGLTRSLQSLEEELGMALFDRIGNRLVLNAYGKTLVEDGQKILEAVAQLETKLQDQYIQNQFMRIGSCAPAPLWALRTTFATYYPWLSMKDEVQAEAQVLLEQLENHHYAAIILDYPVHHPELECIKICDEILHIATTADQPMAQKETVSFHELNGSHFLEYQNTGYWHDLCTERMPDSRFIVENNLELYQIIQRQSTLYTFRTSLTIPRFHLYEERIYLPFTDPEATLTFYLVGPKEIFNKLPELEKHLHEVNWVHYRSEDFDVG